MNEILHLWRRTAELGERPKSLRWLGVGCVSRTRTWREVREQLRLGQRTLTPRQALVAGFLLEHPDQAAFSTSADLAVRAGVSEATVVRLAQTLGFANHTELRALLRRDIQRSLAPASRLRSYGDLGEDRSLVESSLVTDAQSVESVHHGGAESIQEASRTLLDARRIYVVGARSSYGLAHLAAYLLEQFLPETRLLSPSMAAPASAHHTGEGDAALAFSYPRYARFSVDLMRYLASRGVSTVGVTDSLTAPLASICDVVVVAPCASVSFFNSNAAAIAVINSLVATMAAKSKESTLRSLNEAESSLRELNLLLDPPASGGNAGGTDDGKHGHDK